MSISIVACPKCGTLLLHDTVQCHRCRHIIRPDRAGDLRDSALPSDDAVQKDLEICKHCGETYRPGLVRCWSCGAFTRADIEAAYYRLLRGHARSMATAGQRADLQEITEEEARSGFGADDELPFPAGAEVSAVDHDFELSEEVLLRDEVGIPPLPASDFDGLMEDDLLPPGTSPIPPLSLTPPLEIPTLAPPVADESPIEPIPFMVPGADLPPAEAETVPAAKAAAPPTDETDSLLHIAQQQEEEAVQTKRTKKLKGIGKGEGFVVYCPMGCKIRVQERHRGKIGRCPKCQTIFLVPVAKQTSLAGSVPAALPEQAAETSAAVAGPAVFWISDVHLHRVVPQKLRIKTDSLLNDFQEVDLGLSEAGMLLVGLGGGGMFGGTSAKKKEAVRAAVIEHLASQPTLEGLPGNFKQELPREALAQLTMVQPSPEGTESLFGDVQLFGAGRIAGRLPKVDEKSTLFLSFSLSQFREFSRLLGQVFGIERFGANCPLPYEDHYTTASCYLSNAPVRELQQLEYYQKDPAFRLEVSGYQCKGCGAIICEPTRQAQKLGGANGKGIAKVKCSKCKKPMGNQPLYRLEGPEAPVEQVPSAEAGAIAEVAATSA